ncbi:hypothetical protein CCR83_10040 [Rhodobacter veldkampii DSM 11550]|uniref:Metal-dependent peptidase n=1 Tax=Phaeovulum veldkampii DSM 11550 TaxID=1185920 RepID=A0A2T4JG37_9RHOB|nr:VWA-like domain-containing protein [Phaeovulum veldkampii]MBK5946763.1 hypothetical protein [Phaeovulum veldkampii DSM 11550]PTE16856.1 hypothetical protein C5F46_12210 [Phaeovulum veldkampii DSM 11550]TDQ56421.1 putative metal-dependent peptidase [Phaeovulum veldkampii DSM 11550]
MTRHSARAGTALRALNEADPAIAALALWCDHRDRDGGPAAETAGATIYYGPAFATLPLHEQIGLAAHHILHVALRHPQRMQAMAARFADRFDRRLYNIAADAIVNEALLFAGHALPRPALTLSGLLAATQGIEVPPTAALAEWDVDRLYIRLMQGRGGSGRSESDRALAHAASREFGEDIQSEPGAAPDEARAAADWRQHLARAMETGRMAGRGVGLLGHRLADIPTPQTPWEVVLRGLVTRAVTQAPRLSHRRPARSWVAMEAEARRAGGPSPAFQPGVLRSRDVPRIVVALDASGSIDEVRLALFAAEVTGIARRAGAEVHLMVFDEEVQSVTRLDPSTAAAQIGALVLPRGGGTAFGPVIAQAVALRPSVVIVLTDLDGPFGPAPRGLPVIWAVLDASPAPAAPFGHVLSLVR